MQTPCKLTLTYFGSINSKFPGYHIAVWQALCNIPYGQTKSYRAVANANGANQLAIIIPCHRIISSDGTLGGYGGGLAVKQWLLEHETHHQKRC